MARFQILLMTWALTAMGLFAAPATFDVASVKISKAPDAVVFYGGGMVDTASGRFRVPAVGGSVNIVNWSLSGIITAAWDLGPGQLSGPAWMSMERYDIAAKTSPQATQAELRAMLQALLAERFGLATHREAKELSTFALVAAKSGPKLRAAKGDQQSPVLFAPPSRLIGQGSTMQALANALGRPAGRTVTDETGVTGRFDFSLVWSADEMADGGASIFTALQEQLGLRLEPRRSQVEILVVDHAEKIPLAN